MINATKFLFCCVGKNSLKRLEKLRKQKSGLLRSFERILYRIKHTVNVCLPCVSFPYGPQGHVGNVPLLDVCALLPLPFPTAPNPGRRNIPVLRVLAWFPAVYIASCQKLRVAQTAKPLKSIVLICSLPFDVVSVNRGLCLSFPALRAGLGVCKVTICNR